MRIFSSERRFLGRIEEFEGRFQISLEKGKELGFWFLLSLVSQGGVKDPIQLKRLCNSNVILRPTVGTTGFY